MLFMAFTPQVRTEGREWHTPLSKPNERADNSYSRFLNRNDLYANLACFRKGTEETTTYKHNDSFFAHGAAQGCSCFAHGGFLRSEQRNLQRKSRF